MRGFWNFIDRFFGDNSWFHNIFDRLFNRAPEANNDAFAMSEDGEAFSIDVLSNDTDPNGDRLVVSSASAANGVVSINSDGTLHYIPNENYNGIDTIYYTINDGRGGTSSAEVKVTVEAVNDAPTQVMLDTNSVDENSVGAVIGNLSTQDIDDSMHTYSVSDDRFEVVDDILKLKDGVSLDYESESSINLDITSADASGASVTQTLTVDVNDIDESGSSGDGECQMGYRLVGQYSSQESGFFKYNYDITYDDNGNVIKTELDDRGPGYYYDVDGIADTTKEYSYDADGTTIIEATDHLGQTSIEYKTYNENGDLIIDENDFDADGTIDSAIYYGYDEDGNLTHEMHDYDLDGDIEHDVRYVYDDNGNLTSELVTHNVNGSNGSYIGRTDYTYDLDGNMTSMADDVNNDGTIEYLTTYSYAYNQDGYTKTVNYDYGNDGSIDKTTFYTYDNNGLLVSDNDNTVNAVVTYVYEYGCISQNYETPYLDYTYAV
jgi:hypothetical protein